MRLFRARGLGDGASRSYRDVGVVSSGPLALERIARGPPIVTALGALGIMGLGAVWGHLFATVRPCRRWVWNTTWLLLSTGLLAGELALFMPLRVTLVLLLGAVITSIMAHLAWYRALQRRRIHESGRD